MSSCSRGDLRPDCLGQGRCEDARFQPLGAGPRKWAPGAGTGLKVRRWAEMTGVLSIPTFQVGVFCGKVETPVWSSGASPGRLRFQELQVQRSSEKRGELQGGQVPMPCATEMSEQG